MLGRKLGNRSVNPSPNFGFAWNPAAGAGLPGKLTGNHKTVLRGSYTLAYYNEGLNAISNLLSGNRGATAGSSASIDRPPKVRSCNTLA
jgi:hypothetical protein